MKHLRDFKKEVIKRQLSASEMLDFLDECIAKGSVPVARTTTVASDLLTTEQAAAKMRQLFEEVSNEFK